MFIWFHDVHFITDEFSEGFKICTWASVYNYNQNRFNISNLNKKAFAILITKRKIFSYFVIEYISHI